MKPSTFIASKVRIVSSNDSPFFSEELSGEKSKTLKPNLFAACSKESLVLVLGSQNKKQTVLPAPTCSIFGHLLRILEVRSKILSIKSFSRLAISEILFKLIFSQCLLQFYFSLILS